MKTVKNFVKVRNTTEHYRNSEHYKKGEVVSAYGFLTPAMVLAILFIVLPIILAFTYGFTDYYFCLLYTSPSPRDS